MLEGKAMTGSLAGKTLFITGASRGIGKAIALRAARDGASIVIAAKTDQPHPKLPGTIDTAAQEVVAAGGKALAVASIPASGSGLRAVERAVEAFGGIDILVNNASAISLTGTLTTPLKRFDLMMDINARGTWLCSQTCIPHLKKSANPHILVLSPPLDLHPRWFGPHLAYTMSKYSMSMCVVGLAEEFRGDGIAVNALWPRTVIATEALQAHPRHRSRALPTAGDRSRCGMCHFDAPEPQHDRTLFQRRRSSDRCRYKRLHTLCGRPGQCREPLSGSLLLAANRH